MGTLRVVVCALGLGILALLLGPQRPLSVLGEEAGVRWEFNAKELNPARGFAFQPGVPGTLCAKLRPSAEAVLITVSKTLPNGRVQSYDRRLDAHASEARFELGPLAAPARYEFEAGIVYRQGYRLEMLCKAVGKEGSGQRLRFYQAVAEDPGWERFVPGGGNRSVYLSGIRPGQLRWELALSMAPVLALKLHPAVLADQDKLVVEYGGRMKEPAEGVDCVLTIRDGGGKELVRREVKAKAVAFVSKKGAEKQSDWQNMAIDPRAWPPGDYQIALWPKAGVKIWEEGPTVVYRRRKLDPLDVPVSPYTAWRLRRDLGRSEHLWTDVGAAHTKHGHGPLDAAFWEFRRGKSGGALVCGAKKSAPPVAFEPNLRGMYAIFARPYGKCLLQVGRKGLIRPVLEPEVPGTSDTFVEAADLTGQPITLYAFDEVKSGLASLRLVPVSAESAASFYRQTGHPPTPLHGIDDWADYFHGACRTMPDQYDTILGGQAELGMRTLDWAVGRSWIEYHTDLKGTTLFPCVSLEDACKVFSRADDYRHRIKMIRESCPLQAVYAARKRQGVEIWPWLGMQRHYGTKAYGGMFAGESYRQHPEWWCWSKNASGPHEGRMSYYFPEVRQERVGILLDVARKGADGILVGCCRQVPMLLYQRQMVEEYQKRTGIDPRKIDASSGQAYLDWIAWRAEFFTHVLRDLRKGLAVIEKDQKRRIPVAVRVPSAGLFYNLAQGLAVETWCKEKLVDTLQVDPLEDRAGRGSHDVRPYLTLARRHGVRIVAGIGSTWESPVGLVPSLKRAAGLLALTPDGIEIYEAEMLAQSSQHRWVLPMFGNPSQIDRTLHETNLEACYPVHSTNACYGHDNHSFHAVGWDVYGFTDHSL